MAKPDNEWIEEWRIGERPSRENSISKDLLKIFIEFSEALSLGTKSKATQSRYCSAMHALGGWIVEKSLIEDKMTMAAIDLLKEYVSSSEGPLAYRDNEKWQIEFDMVCRKLHKYIWN
jgi:hypothetical protein